MFCAVVEVEVESAEKKKKDGDRLEPPLVGCNPKPYFHAKSQL